MHSDLNQQVCESFLILMKAPHEGLVSHAAWRDIAKHLPTAADEDDAMARRVSGIPFYLVVGHQDSFTDLAVRAVKWAIGSIVRDDRDILAVAHLECIGPIRVGLAAAGEMRIIRLHQRLKPLPYIGG